MLFDSMFFHFLSVSFKKGQHRDAHWWNFKMKIKNWLQISLDTLNECRDCMHLCVLAIFQWILISVHTLSCKHIMFLLDFTPNRPFSRRFTKIVIDHFFVLSFSCQMAPVWQQWYENLSTWNFRWTKKRRNLNYHNYLPKKHFLTWYFDIIFFLPSSDFNCECQLIVRAQFGKCCQVVPIISRTIADNRIMYCNFC